MTEEIKNNETEEAETEEAEAEDAEAEDAEAEDAEAEDTEAADETEKTDTEPVKRKKPQGKRSEHSEKTGSDAHSSRPQRTSSRRFRHSAVSLAAAVFVLVAVILLNLIASVLTDKYSSLTADITSLKSFELTESSIALAQSVKKDTEIIFLTDKNTYEADDPYCKQTALVAQELARCSDGKITVTFSDLIRNPALADRYGSDLKQTDVIVRSGEKYKVLTANDLYNFSYYSATYQYITSSKAEQAIDNAVNMVTGEIAAHIGIVTDHSAEDSSYLKSFLESNNYRVTEIELLTQEIPSDVSTLVIFAPSSDYTAEVMKKLESYMVNDGQYNRNIIYAAYKREVSLPNMDAFISMFGMKLENGLAFDMDSSRLLSTSYYDGIVSYFASEKYTGRISEKDYPVLVGFARPVVLLDEGESEPLIRLSDHSGFCPYDADETTWNMPDSVTGQVYVMAQGTAGTSEAVSTLVVSGSANIFLGDYMGTDFGNSAYVLEMFDKLNDVESDNVTIAEKVITDYDLVLDQNTRFFVGFLMYGVLPITILGIGFAVFLIRRGK